MRPAVGGAICILSVAESSLETGAAHRVAENKTIAPARTRSTMSVLLMVRARILKEMIRDAVERVLSRRSQQSQFMAELNRSWCGLVFCGRKGLAKEL